jgi:hypothetical protein
MQIIYTSNSGLRRSFIGSFIGSLVWALEKFILIPINAI